MARTFPLAHEAVVSFRTQSGGASLPSVAGLTQTHSVGVVAFAVILTATFLCAVSAVRANGTLVLATMENETHRGAVSQSFSKMALIRKTVSQQLNCNYENHIILSRLSC